ncbi:MAG: hypothetical protein ABIG37_01210 [Nanoarchaeota archaeon]|nr:hypothetical protein [Nanoarchaeota archaeon]
MPTFVGLSPYFGEVYLAGWAMHKLDGVSEDVKELKKFNRAPVGEINNLKSNCIKNHFLSKTTCV